MTKKELNPRIIVDIAEDLVTINITMRRPEKFNARLLQRIIRDMQRQRRIELKKILNKAKLKKEDFNKKYSTEGESDGRRQKREQAGAGEAEETRGDDPDISRLAEEVGREL
jgi:hypothetical protein